MDSKAKIICFSLGQWFVGISILFLVSLLLLLSYRLLPINQKIAGSWQTEADQPHELKISDNQANLVVEELNGMSGVYMKVNATIFPVDSTRYRGKETSALLIIDKEKQGKDVLDAIKKQDNYYTLVNETKEQITFKYTSEANIAAFGVEDLDTSFHFEVIKWQYGLIPKEIQFQNQAFAVNGLHLTKK
ncbi:hypothetical protein RV12_GL002081 [Enterococcus quebecensis]|nr:hypothetical protein RV12_GL002081 [Enterococcus quebecensis]